MFLFFALWVELALVIIAPILAHAMLNLQAAAAILR